ncbi:MAG TPA: pyridoxal phosphate-dependent aminotransferase [Thermoanaerobaculia bacterium]
MDVRVSHRGAEMPASPIRRLAPAAEEAKRKGIRVIHLNIGQPDLPTPEPILRRLTEIHDPILCYTPSNGTPEFVRSAVEYYARAGIRVSAGNVLATTGGSEALLFALMACCDPGDEAIVVEPFYTNYASFAAMAGVRLVPVTSRGREGFHLPPPAVWERALSDRTRVILLCNPNNPTGTVYRPEEIEMVARFCRDRGIFLLSDEVYREFVYGGRKAISALSLEGMERHVIVADSLSKRFNVCGIRLGLLVTRNAEVYDAAYRMAQGRLSAPGLAQQVALGAAEIPDHYLDGVVAEYRRRRDVLFEGLTSIPGVFLLEPEGAFYFIARLPITDSDDFAAWLLSEFSRDGETVMVAPAAGFYATPGLGKNEVRIAYVVEEEALRRAVAILAEAILEYRKVRGIEALPLEEPSEKSRR